ncbi:radical SAM protein [archaeon]|jgi:anaerobic magnesium-protoporphyrin IX monomethyl ester cyclase|nr:radical SAM protein [archaeon]MBT4373126.1 radical SAM protein [archaeon]MBT4531471.1 radical SAM protein [archaeon]MBT7001351.1 radical SAM protein [archaeon]MBT7282163.1 radical SAM protein [archaeon]
MKILIGYPPTESKKGIATLGQNRQFQWFSNPSYFYPIVPATAATMLKEGGNKVIWLDCVAERVNMQKFLKLVEKEKPEIFAFETKTPVIKQHWETINNLKKKFPKMKIVIYGDHVTSFPKETMENSQIDFVLCGGNYDFILQDLVKYLEDNKKNKIPRGVYYRRGKRILSSGAFVVHQELDNAPFIDRELTKWQLYQEEYNLIGKPFFYIMSGRDCWWGKCTFCSWPRMYPKFNHRSVKNVLDEIKMLIEKYDVKEIFDDSGTLTTGKWLKDLCQGLIERGYNKKIKYSCNMRFGALKQEDYNLMKRAGFRLLKFGLESANQSTLDRLNKGVKIKDILEGSKMAQKAGLMVHLTMIVGYPWETKEDAMKTYELAKFLMQRGHADILQSTVLMPYPGTQLWEEAKANRWLLLGEREYERYDQREPVLKTKDSRPEDIAAICGKIYTIFLTPQYIFQRIKSIKSWEDFKFNIKGVKAVIGHLKDFLK